MGVGNHRGEITQDLKDIVADMRLGATYRIIWSPLAEIVWLQETCNKRDWMDVRLLQTAWLEMFLNMVRYAGFFVRVRTNGSGSRTYDIV